MIVVLASCMVSTFIVMRRNSSLVSFIFFCRAASARKILSSRIPCTLSRKASHMEVYLPQYFAKIFFAYFETAMIESGMSGTHASSTSAVRQSTGDVTQKRMTGAAIA